jgi:quercetin dioxygenase-like cupin family protein
MASEPRSGWRVLGNDDFEIWLLYWPAGSSVSPHDHGDSGGAFTVVSGELTEVRWADGSPSARRVVPGTVIDIEKGVVHDVLATEDPALSLHLYAPPLRAMGFYRADGASLARIEAVGETPDYVEENLVRG